MVDFQNKYRSVIHVIVKEISYCTTNTLLFRRYGDERPNHESGSESKIFFLRHVIFSLMFSTCSFYLFSLMLGVNGTYVHIPLKMMIVLYFCVLSLY